MGRNREREREKHRKRGRERGRERDCQVNFARNRRQRLTSPPLFRLPACQRLRMGTRQASKGLQDMWVSPWLAKGKAKQRQTNCCQNRETLVKMSMSPPWERLSPDLSRSPQFAARTTTHFHFTTWPRKWREGGGGGRVEKVEKTGHCHIHTVLSCIM